MNVVRSVVVVAAAVVLSCCRCYVAAGCAVVVGRQQAPSPLLRGGRAPS